MQEKSRVSLQCHAFPNVSNMTHIFFYILSYDSDYDFLGGGGRTVAQLVERTTPREEVVGSIPAVAARSLLVGSVSV